jgi:ATP-binding cassette, subfamily B, bacterial HlyB/CyaB
MNVRAGNPTERGRAEADQTTSIDSGLAALALVAAYFQIAADPHQLSHELALSDRSAGGEDLVRGARLLGLKARAIVNAKPKRLRSTPLPAIIGLSEGGFAVLAAGGSPDGFRLVHPIDRFAKTVDAEEIAKLWNGAVVLVARRLGGAGVEPKTFGFQWFLPSIWRYRRALSNVLIASLFVQIFALATPLFFQLIIDKVLIHKGYSTLIVLIAGLVGLGFFDSLLQYLRTYTLSHTTNRIDVELGSRLFHHLFQLPLAYFETRAAGQTVARVRELETIRNFLTGQGLTSLLDLLFTAIFISVLFFYSVKLTLIVLICAPLYVLIAILIRPPLRRLINEKFNRGARSQQFLVESIVGAHTLKAASVEPVIQTQWEDRLAAYIRTSFDATLLGAMGQNAFQFISKVTTAMILLFGATAVIEGSMTVGELVAFNMIASQAIQPILRLSQLWQDFQQIQISVDRLGDILNTPAERTPQNNLTPPPLRGAIELRGVTFRYRPESPPVLRDISLTIQPGEVIGIFGPSGSGKSTIAKLIQRFYSPEIGQVLLDEMDSAQLNPSWLRRQMGVVLQENLLFNRSIHENIAFASPAMSRARVMHAARLAGADEFVAALPQGYDTLIEERGANLSGGQRQRLAVARALSVNPRILIFDEATSALDYKSERIILQNMQTITRGRTVIIIAHRLAALRPCTRLIGMNNGQIVEHGSSDELLKTENSLYSQLWAMQSEHNGG